MKTLPRVKAIWATICIWWEWSVSHSLYITHHYPWPIGGWLKMERSFFLKKRRADFVAGSLSGRVIVAGGLGKDGAFRLEFIVVLVLGGSLALCICRKGYWLLADHLPTTLLQKIQSTPFLPAWILPIHYGPQVWPFCPPTRGKL